MSNQALREISMASMARSAWLPQENGRNITQEPWIVKNESMEKMDGTTQEPILNQPGSLNPAHMLRSNQTWEYETTMATRQMGWTSCRMAKN